MFFIVTNVIFLIISIAIYIYIVGAEIFLSIISRMWLFLISPFIGFILNGLIGLGSINEFNGSNPFLNMALIYITIPIVKLVFEFIKVKKDERYYRKNYTNVKLIVDKYLYECITFNDDYDLNIFCSREANSIYIKIYLDELTFNKYTGEEYENMQVKLKELIGGQENIDVYIEKKSS